MLRRKLLLKRKRVEKLIKKFFIYGKQIYFSGHAPDNNTHDRTHNASIGRVIEVKMPVAVFWELQKIVDDLSYIQSSNTSSSTELNSTLKDLFSKLSKWAVQEGQRHWLKEKAGLK